MEALKILALKKFITSKLLNICVCMCGQCWINCEGSVFLRPGKLFCLLNNEIVDLNDLIPLLAKGC